MIYFFKYHFDTIGFLLMNINIFLYLLRSKWELYRNYNYIRIFSSYEIHKINWIGIIFINKIQFITKSSWREIYILNRNQKKKTHFHILGPFSGGLDNLRDLIFAFYGGI